MGKRARVQHDAVRVRFLDLGAQFALDVALKKFTFRAAGSAKGGDLAVDLFQGLRAVDALFAAARHIEIDTVQKQ